MPRPPLLVVVVLVLVGLLPPLAASARPGAVRTIVPGATHGDRIPAGADRILRRQLAKIRASRRSKARAASALTGLKDGPWCGSEQATDDTTFQAHTGPRVKVIYAYPAGSVNRFETMRDLIQGDARDMSDLVLSAAAQTRTLRFDVGTRCGAGYVDILSIALPRTAAAYRQLGAGARMAQLRTDITPAVANMVGKRNYLVYADHTNAGDGVSGIATVFLDDSPGASNASNGGGLWSMVYGNTADPGFLGGRLTTALHEVSHNLGAVQDSAPHSTLAGHCFDESDVMCYDDGGPAAVMTFPCAAQAYDCGADDYFNPAPAPGSYLDTHWNLHRSVFLCPAGSCAGADAGGGNPLPIAAVALRDTNGQPLAAATAGVPVLLDGGGSTDDEAPVAQYAWDVGADGTVEGREARLRTVLSAPGEVPVRLTVRDVYGAAGSVTVSVRVIAPVATPPAKPAIPPALSRRQAAAAALRASLGALRGALRNAQKSARLRVSFTAPQRGRLQATVRLEGRTLATATRSVSAGRRNQVVVVLSRTARRRLARGGTVSFQLSFRGADGRPITARRSVKLPAR